MITDLDTLHRLSLAVATYKILSKVDPYRNSLLTELAMAYDVPRSRLALETLEDKEHDRRTA